MSRINSTATKYAILFFSCVLFHILGTWSLPLIDRDEPRFAEASREMIERGNYIVPYFNNQLRLDKPPLTYWAQVASYHIFGENDFAARFPSAIAAALTAILIFAWGRRIGGEKLGWWAAIIFTLSLQTFVHAKAAVADMWLVLFVTLASWAGYRTVSTPNAEPRSGGLPGAVALAKAAQTAVGDLEIALPCFLSLARARLSCQRPNCVDTAADRRWLNHLHARLAGVTALQVCGRCCADACSGRALGNPGADSNTWGVFHSGNRTTRRRPFVYDTGRSRRELLRHVRATIAVLFCHGLHQFLSVVDQVAVVDSQIMAEQRGRGHPPSPRLRRTSRPGYSGSPVDIYLLSGIAVIFVIFTIVSTKLPHYTLPAFPLLALLLARHWSQGAAVSSPPTTETAAPGSQPSRSQLRVCGSQLPLWCRQSWRGFSPRISSFKCLASLCSRTCNLLRSSSRSQVWSGIFAPASKVFSRR